MYFCMPKRNALFASCLSALVLGVPLVSSAQQGDGTKDANEEITGKAPAVLWREPIDFASRNLLLGPAEGRGDAPAIRAGHDRQ